MTTENPGEELYRAAFMAAPLPMVLVDSDGHVVAANDATGSLLAERAPVTGSGFGVLTEAGVEIEYRSDLGGAELVVLKNPPESPPPAERATVLVTDDDRNIREAISAALTQAGHRVLLARDAEEAEALFGADPAAVDLLVTDVVMPRASGDELVGRLRSRRPDMPVLVVTGYGPRPPGSLDSPSAPTAELSKPFLVQELLEATRALLNSNKRP